MTDMRGNRFDLLQPGRHTFIQIPQGAAALATLLHVEAEVQPVGDACADMYIQHVNVTGKWADDLRDGGFQYYPMPNSSRHSTKWMGFGKVELKVVWSYIDHGSARWPFLNFYARLLGQAGHPVGGLLGDDDHIQAATPRSSCSSILSLHQLRIPRKLGGSIVLATLA